MSTVGNSDMRKLIKALEEQGFTVTLTRNRHYMVRSPEGRVVATMSSSPSDWRTLKNALSHLRKAGFRWGR